MRVRQLWCIDCEQFGPHRTIFAYLSPVQTGAMTRKLPVRLRSINGGGEYIVRSMSRLGRTVLIAVAALFLSIGQAGATVYNLSFASAGWYSDLGDHDPSNRSHLTGEIFIPGPRGKRSFVVFILSLFR
jgi:hypothetical protein